MNVETPNPAQNARTGYPIDGIIHQLWTYQAMLTRDWEDIGQHDPDADTNLNERMGFVSFMKTNVADYVAHGAKERAYSTVSEWIRIHRWFIKEYAQMEEGRDADRFYASIDTFMRERVYDFFLREGNEK